MAKPSTTVTWATDTNFASGSEIGTPTKVDPSSGFKAQGWIPGAAAIAQYMNHVLNVIGQWITYLNLSGTDEITYANTRTRTILVPFSAGCPGDVDPTGSTFCPGTTGGLTLSYASWTMPVVLPHGSILKSVIISCVPDGSPSSGTISATLKKATINRGTYTNTVATIASDTVPGVVNDNLEMTGLSETIDRANVAYYVEIYSTTDATAFDSFRHFEVIYEETRATGSN